MNKFRRQQKVLEIVSKTEVDTQEELLKILEDQGLKVTQATVSRDIKELGLVKIAGKIKKYRYAKPLVEEQNDVNVLVRHFKTAILSITHAQNLIVIKTLSGNALAGGVTMLADSSTLTVGAESGEAATTFMGKIAGGGTTLVKEGTNYTLTLSGPAAAVRAK